jgi:hypothetical protein
MPVILVLGRWGQKDHKFEASLDYIVSSRKVGYITKLYLKKEKKKKKDREKEGGKRERQTDRKREKEKGERKSVVLEALVLRYPKGGFISSLEIIKISQTFNLISFKFYLS